MKGAIVVEACACPLWASHRSKLDLYTIALPSRVPMTLTKPGRFRHQQRPVYWLVFLELMRATVVARSVIARLSLLSTACNACPSTKQRSARFGAC
jgi:hypothetical protein